jgi:hypothetical protein
MAINDVYKVTASFSQPAFVNGFNPIVLDQTTTVIEYGPGTAKAFNTDFVMEYPGAVPGLPGTITVNTAVVGANGVFPLSLADSNVVPDSGSVLVPVFLIGKSSGTTGGSLDSNVAPAIVIPTRVDTTTPSLFTGFLPEGYDTYVMVGVCVLTSTATLVPLAMGGNGFSRHVTLGSSIPVATITASASGTIDLTALSYVAASVDTVDFLYEYTPAAAADILTFTPTGLTPATGLAPVQVKTNGTVVVRDVFTMTPGIDNSPSALGINYTMTQTSDAVNVWVSGLRFSPFLVSPQVLLG